MKKLMAGMAVLALSTGGFIMGAGSAFAGTVPSCVGVSGGVQSKVVGFQNNCTDTVRVKVIINNWPDSPCHTLPPGQFWSYSWSIGSYDGVATC